VRLSRKGASWIIIATAAGAAMVAGCAARAIKPEAPAIPEVARTPAEIGATLGRWILVEKRARQLVVYDDTKPIRTYPIVLGEDPLGAKMHEGDNRTPEGEYHIAAKYPHRAWSRFMLLDYPTPMNRDIYEWSRRSGLLPAGRGSMPGIGGQVGIHGTVDDGVNRRGENWTRGCISLFNRDVEELYSLVEVGTRVVIEK